jgi:nicotinamidase/pyrazinamidase
MKALIIVDVQVDFCPGGALPAPDGNKIIPIINNLMDKFCLVVASRDWHPQNSKHFEKWPVHCVQGRNGSDFHSDLNISKIQKIFLKGTEDKDDGYSAFEATNEDLNENLKQSGVTELYITGLTTEYCIKNTALDSVSNGYKTYVVKDAIAAVQEKPQDEKNAIEEMKNAGIEIVESNYI